MKNQKRKIEKIVSNCKQCKFNEEERCIKRNKSIYQTQKEPCVFFDKKTDVNLLLLLGGAISSLFLFRCLKKKKRDD